MNNNSLQKTTFWDLINKKEIIIPKIQRDYVQGQDANKSIRFDFLNSIKKALDTPNDYNMILDFVYGMSDEEKFIPIDGQQRLTTLWLLHWYLALRCNKLNNQYRALLRKFNYQTRPSSNRVFSKFLDISPEKIQSKGIVKYIRDQAWFHDEYIHDPTVESLLAILGSSDNSLEQIFDGSSSEQLEKYLDLLIDSKRCPIFFYLLDMKENGLSDDLYIKMNARGEMLDNLEKIKVDILDIIKDKPAISDEVSKAFDNKWLLPFCLRETNAMNSEDFNIKEYEDFDELFYVFILRYYFSYYALEKDDSKLIEQLYKTVFHDENIKRYHSLSQFKVSLGESSETLELNATFVESFSLFMNNFLMFFNEYNNIPHVQDNWFLNKTKEMYFIPKFSNEKNIIEPISQIQIIVFTMLVKFFREFPNEPFDINKECKLLIRWLRVIWNTVSIVDKYGDNVIRSSESMVSAINYLKSLNSHDVYNSLINNSKMDDYKNENNMNLSAFEKSIMNEYIKAKKIMESNEEDWENKIINAEGLNYLDGDISFLYINGNSIVNWKDFDNKLIKYNNYFKENNIENKERFSDFICCFSEERLKNLNDYHIYLWEDKYLLSWRVMLNSSDMRPEVHSFLTNTEKPIQEELHKRIIAAYEIKRDPTNSDLYKDNVFLKYDENNGFYAYRYYGHSSKCLSIKGGPIDEALKTNNVNLNNNCFNYEDIKLYSDYRAAYIINNKGKNFILRSDCFYYCNEDWKSNSYNNRADEDENWYENCRIKILKD